MKKKLRAILAAVIILATFGAFVYYSKTHPAVLEKVGDTNPLLMVLLVVCYTVWFLALVFIMRVSLQLYDMKLSGRENLLLNAYSSLVNFFGPGQSGPAVRGLYLKKRHGLALKKYLFATLLYYGFYAVISACFLCIGSLAWWKTLLLVGLATAISWTVIGLYAKRSRLRNQPGINLVNLSWLFAATAVQLVVQVVIFYIELNAVSDVDPAQALTYTGAANFALFVAITPGAIGIREAFLVFSQNLHHISNNVIVAANVLDRAMYLLFLGLLFILTMSLHAKETLRIKRYTADEEKPT